MENNGKGMLEQISESNNSEFTFGTLTQEKIKENT
jgi:hypothetical protein